MGREIIRHVNYFLIFICFVPVSGWCSGNYTFGGEFSDHWIPADQSETKGWMNTATINVGQHYIIDDLNVKISLRHSNVFDLQIFLESPSGSRICLNMYNAKTGYFQGADYSGTVFDDEAAVSISDGVAPFSGSFRPMDGYALSVFNGEDAFGPWKLDIYDSWAFDSGQLDSFEIMVEAPEPLSIALFLIGSVIVVSKQHKN